MQKEKLRIFVNSFCRSHWFNYKSNRTIFLIGYLQQSSASIFIMCLKMLIKFTIRPSSVFEFGFFTCSVSNVAILFQSCLFSWLDRRCTQRSWPTLFRKFLPARSRMLFTNRTMSIHSLMRSTFDINPTSIAW